MDDSGKGLWPHFDLDQHITDLRQDDPRALPRRGEFLAFVLPSPGIEEPNLHPWRVHTHLTLMVIPAFHLYACQMELAAREGMDPFHAFLQVMCITLIRWSIGVLWHWTT